MEKQHIKINQINLNQSGFEDGPGKLQLRCKQKLKISGLAESFLS